MAREPLHISYRINDNAMLVEADRELPDDVVLMLMRRGRWVSKRRRDKDDANTEYDVHMKGWRMFKGRSDTSDYCLKPVLQGRTPNGWLYALHLTVKDAGHAVLTDVGELTADSMIDNLAFVTTQADTDGKGLKAIWMRGLRGETRIYRNEEYTGMTGVFSVMQSSTLFRRGVFALVAVRGWYGKGVLYCRQLTKVSNLAPFALEVQGMILDKDGERTDAASFTSQEMFNGAELRIDCGFRTANKNLY